MAYDKKVYDKQYAQDHKAQYRANKERYAKAHPERCKESMARYYLKTKAAHKTRAYAWRKANPEKVLEKLKTHRKKCLRVWLELLKARGMTVCARCGYDECFAAIEFHHINPEEKELGKREILQHLPNKKRLAELKKVIPLCANCHRSFHAGVWKELLEIN